MAVIMKELIKKQYNLEFQGEYFTNFQSEVINEERIRQKQEEGLKWNQSKKASTSKTFTTDSTC